MGVHDREWMREKPQHRQPTQPIVVKILVFVNLFIFLLEMFNRKGLGQWFEIYGSFRFVLAFEHGFIWQVITYQFLHANLGHLLFNMLALWVFGNAVERQFGHIRFLLFYLVCGISSALFSSLLGWLGVYHLDPAFGIPWDYVSMIGASGSIYGVIAASAVLFPYGRIALLFPPVVMSVRTFALVVLGIAIAYIIFNWDNAGGEAGHLGGMLMGFFIMGVRGLAERFRHS